MLDANGNPINGDDITPGRSARVEVEEEDGEYSAQRIEVEDEDDEGHGAEVEFSGKVQTVSGGTLTIEASFGVATVLIGPNTEVKGTLNPGVAVKVHADVQADGSYLARQIEAKGGQTDGGGGDDNGGGGDDDGTPSSGSGDGGGSDSSGHGSDGSGSDDEPEEEGG